MITFFYYLCRSLPEDDTEYSFSWFINNTIQNENECVDRGNKKKKRRIIRILVSRTHSQLARRVFIIICVTSLFLYAWGLCPKHAFIILTINCLL